MLGIRCVVSNKNTSTDCEKKLFQSLDRAFRERYKGNLQRIG